MTIEFMRLISKLINRVKNLRFSLMRFAARFIFVRRIYFILNRRKKTNWNLKESVFKNINIEFFLKTLHENGYAKGLNLPKELIEEIHQYTKKFPCYGDQKNNKGFLYEQKQLLKQKGMEFMTGFYPNLIENCPAIKKISIDPMIWFIAENYLGFKPQLVQTSLWWVFPKNSSEMEQNIWAQKFHHDVDDYRFIKFFFYLTDVDENSAPHVYVSSSHLNKKISFQASLKRRTDEEIFSSYEDQKIITILGKKGTGFVGDTYCFHKASVPISRDRLVLQLQFAKNNYHKEPDKIDTKYLKQIDL
tara:strand:+ start:86 stop:994 length:909 start_codon:yes stop_codon:yes gene_type:complete